MNLFVYGTLLVPKIWNAVTSCPDLISHPALLEGYDIFRVRNADYPCIVESAEPGKSVPGRVFLSVPEGALKLLDAYEDSFYDRRTLTVIAAGIGDVSADAYCLATCKAAAVLGSDSWTIDWFEETALSSFWERTFAK